MLVQTRRIREIQEKDTSYYCVVDFLMVLRNTDFSTAQTYFHVLHNRLRRNGEKIPDLKKIKAKAADGKAYLTYFTSLNGIEMLLSYLAPNLKKTEYQIKNRKDDEVIQFHPRVIAELERMGWQTKHHVKLPSGNVIDILASYEGTDSVTMIVECKFCLKKQHLYEAIGQVLCYRSEYDLKAIPAIATFSSATTEYAREHCRKLGIKLIEIDE